MKYIPISLRIQVPETREELLQILDNDPKMIAALSKASIKISIKRAMKEVLNDCDPISEQQANDVLRY